MAGKRRMYPLLEKKSPEEFLNDDLFHALKNLRELHSGETIIKFSDRGFAGFWRQNNLFGAKLTSPKNRLHC